MLKPFKYTGIAHREGRRQHHCYTIVYPGDSPSLDVYTRAVRACLHTGAASRKRILIRKKPLEGYVLSGIGTVKRQSPRRSQSDNFGRHFRIYI